MLSIYPYFSPFMSTYLSFYLPIPFYLLMIASYHYLSLSSRFIYSLYLCVCVCAGSQLRVRRVEAARAAAEEQGQQGRDPQGRRRLHQGTQGTNHTSI